MESKDTETTIDRLIVSETTGCIGRQCRRRDVSKYVQIWTLLMKGKSTAIVSCNWRSKIVFNAIFSVVIVLYFSQSE